MKKKFSYKLLSAARCSRGLNKSQLAALIGVTRQAVSLFEQGKSEPSNITIEKIAQVLKFPIEYFYEENLNEIEYGTPIFFRKFSNTTKSTQEKAKVKVNWYFHSYNFLTKYLKEFTLNLPYHFIDSPINYNNLSNESIESLAEKLREYWNLRLGPIVGLTSLLEKNGIIIFQIDIESDINGFSFYSKTNKAFIIVSKNVTPFRNRFNLAHELAHLILHALNIRECNLIENHNTFEYEANYFAGAFLFPKKSFLHEFISTDLNYLLKLKQRWGLSISAIMQRAYNLNLISNTDLEYFYKKHSGIRKNEPLDKEFKIEKPSFLSNGLKLLLEKNILNVDELKINIPLDTKELIEIFNVDHNIFENQESFGNILQLNNEYIIE